MTASESTLASGLRVIHRRHEGPLASVYLWFDAGTVDETAGLEGAAHLLEHMLFKGTTTRGVGECAAAIEALGGDLNAYTTWDQTVLHATVLAEHWESALEVLADMAWCSRLDPDELELERPVVLEEIRGYDEDPGTQVDDRATARRFPGHSYGVPVLGTAETVSGITHAALTQFWRQNYGITRCVLGIAGPMASERVAAVATGLDEIAFPGEPRRPIPALPTPTTGLDLLDPGSFDTPIAHVGFRAPGDRDPRACDLAALEVLANAMGSGRASLLQSELRIRSSLCAEVWASLYTRRGAGSLDIGFVPTPGKTQEALSALFVLIDAIRHGRLSDVEVARARNNVLSDLKFSGETVDGVAHELAWFTGRLGGIGARDRWMAEIAAVDAHDVLEAARTWLVDPDIVVLDPDGKKLAVPTPAPDAVPDPVVSGVSVHFSGQTDGWPHQGRMAAVTLAVPGGRLLEVAATAGLTASWASMITTGAGPWDSVALAEQLDALSASIGAVAGRNTTAIQLIVPAVNIRPALHILKTVVLEPRFDSSEWNRIRQEALFDLDTLSDRPDEVLSRRMWKLVWDGHPWALSRTRTTLRAISTRRLLAHHRSCFSRDSLAIGVAGDVDRQAVLDGLGPLVEGIPAGKPLAPRSAPKPWNPGLFTSRAGQDQAVLAIAMRTPPMGHAHEVSLRVASSLFSAQAGRLFLALRERESLAYSLWCRVWEGLDGGLFTLGLATDATKWSQAHDGLIREFASLAEDGPTDQELARTLAMELGQYAMGQQRAASRALHLALCALYGKDPHLDAHRREIATVTPESIRRALTSLPRGVSAVVRP